MKCFFGSIVLLLGMSAACGTASALETGVAEACAACHRGPLSLADRDSEQLSERIAALAADRGTHPVAVPMLSAADLALLAQRLKNGT